jgi:hypothetical protein
MGMEPTRLTHLVIGGRRGNLPVAGHDLTLPESRRAVVWIAWTAPRRSRGSYWVRLVGCGATDRVGRTPKEQIEPPDHFVSSGHVVENVCCWHQERNESAVVFFRSFCSS